MDAAKGRGKDGNVASYKSQSVPYTGTGEHRHDSCLQGSTLPIPLSTLTALTLEFLSSLYSFTFYHKRAGNVSSSSTLARPWLWIKSILTGLFFSPSF